MQAAAARLSSGAAHRALFEIHAGAPTTNEYDECALVSAMHVNRHHAINEFEPKSPSDTGRYSSFETICHRFHWELVKVGVASDIYSLHVEKFRLSVDAIISSTAGGLENSLLSSAVKVVEQFARRLPLIETLLNDIGYNPSRFESWLRFVKELMELYFVLMDSLAEVELVGAIPAECHEFDDVGLGVDGGLPSFRDCLTLFSPQLDREDFVLEILSRKRMLLHVINRAFRALRNAYLYSDAIDDSDAKLKLADSFEAMGNLYYHTSLQFLKGSEMRRKYVQQAYASFEEGMVILQLT
jgi:hypothetical protein